MEEKRITPEQALKALEGLWGGLREAGTEFWYWSDAETIRRFVEESRNSQ